MYWLGLASAACASVGYLLWTWHDQTMVDGLGSPHVMREQTKADHAASIAFAIGRVILAATALEIIRRQLESKS